LARVFVVEGLDRFFLFPRALRKRAVGKKPLAMMEWLIKRGRILATFSGQ
jgi:uncharacterized protein YjeT (DUF2065 family)